MPIMQRDVLQHRPRYQDSASARPCINFPLRSLTQVTSKCYIRNVQEISLCHCRCSSPTLLVQWPHMTDATFATNTQSPSISMSRYIILYLNKHSRILLMSIASSTSDLCLNYLQRAVTQVLLFIENGENRYLFFFFCTD